MLCNIQKSSASICIPLFFNALNVIIYFRVNYHFLVAIFQSLLHKHIYA